MAVKSGLDYVAVHGHDVRVQILKSDWVKIAPYVESGYFGVTEFPVSEFGVQTDKDRLYDRILATLQQLFTDEYPTSEL